MPGPIVHNKINKQIFWKSLFLSYIKSTGWFWFWEGILPDIKKFNNLSHGWDYTRYPHLNYQTGTGIFTQIKTLYDDVLYTKDKSKVHKKLYYLSHLISDCFLVGQLSFDLWGKKDDVIDLRAEFVWRKAKDVKNAFILYNNFDSWIQTLFSMSGDVYYKYHTSAIFNELTRKDIKMMTRKAVSSSVSMMLSLLFLIEQNRE